MGAYDIIFSGQDGRKIAYVTAAGRGGGAVQTQTIEIPGIRDIDAVIGASITGGYFLNSSLCTVAGNKVTVEPMYFAYNTDGGVTDAPAIDVPAATPLAAETIALVVIGH
jgi:hypothetical protein